MLLSVETYRNKYRYNFSHKNGLGGYTVLQQQKDIHTYQISQTQTAYTTVHYYVH